ncbi:MAG: thioredoxin-dependent thiol peroxidase [Zetaproteobacteria bacterium]|nr:MAG: thioredoxin-dependent thiol peroxidase [Zetaproteobacteria bacterium]
MSDYAIGEGDTVPSISVPAWPEGEINLADMKGQWMVIYFYPKDSTPGCTTESCDFRDAHAALQKMGVKVFGVSRDSLRSHQRFAEKHQLPFQLLSDADERLCEAFDVIRMKNMYGRQVRGIERSTFVVDPQGVIRRVWRKVKVKGHVDDVMSALTELMSI